MKRSSWWQIAVVFFVFFFNDTATTEIYTLSLHDALPISRISARVARPRDARLLKMPANSPILLSESINVDQIGRAHV